MFGARGLPRQLQKMVSKRSSWRASLLDEGLVIRDHPGLVPKTVPLVAPW
jgi:hypothetical protein